MEIDQSFLNLAWYLAAGAGLLLFLVIALWIFRGFMTSGGALMLKGRNKRLGVVDQAAIDGRRRLVLIRRDGVEHLVMTGGPIDIVIETGIGANGPHPYKDIERAPSSPLDDERIRIAEAQTGRS
ncbi:flagellar biosynthetic protein FliO [Dichotomicrobium thermohalophilum]|uniref:Flagellar biosynthesis protein FliO n=1 Tax=Dichotomicrobium thermohalophilum TaxID=933063 RepID=A0A397Q7N2_9HYPH|nr:flagellar biosynthetic protein FliO [Dichotomicrobium thermohalophilum]RIA55825.1 flagellar biosynthesis protein FliO [Dichotomicrobium thermohalophilum]